MWKTAQFYRQKTGTKQKLIPIVGNYRMKYVLEFDLYIHIINVE